MLVEVEVERKVEGEVDIEVEVNVQIVKHILEGYPICYQTNSKLIYSISTFLFGSFLLIQTGSKLN